MADSELEAFWRLDELGLILIGEYFSPFKAGRQHYSRMLEKYEARFNGSSRHLLNKQSSLPPEAKACADENSNGTKLDKEL